jgi:hypothetical protein
VREFLIAGRNPTAEARAARQARKSTGQIYGTPACPLTPLNPEWDQAMIDLLLRGDIDAIEHFDIAEITAPPVAPPMKSAPGRRPFPRLPPQEPIPEPAISIARSGVDRRVRHRERNQPHRCRLSPA